MFKLVLIQNLQFNNKEHFIHDIIRFADAYGLTGHLPENYRNSESWTDEALQSFLTKHGGDFLYNSIDARDEIEDWLNDPEKSHATYVFVEDTE